MESEEQPDRNGHGCMSDQESPLSHAHIAEQVQDRKQEEVKYLLSQLHSGNYSSIYGKLLTIGLTEASTMQSLIDQVLDKAPSEAGAISMCSQLYQDLYADVPDISDTDAQLDHSGKPQRKSFRRLLIQKFQNEFEYGTAAATQSESEDVVLQHQRRQRYMRAVQVLGHLYKRSMLTEKILHYCILHLLGVKDGVHEAAVPASESVQCVCKLMSIIGSQLDSNPKSRLQMQAYFSRISRWSDLSALDPSLRLVLKDLIILRLSKWPTQSDGRSSDLKY